MRAETKLTVLRAGNNDIMIVHGCNTDDAPGFINVYGTDMEGNSYNIEGCLFDTIIDNFGETQLILHISENEILTSNKWKL